jgi:stringent starvation protein B
MTADSPASMTSNRPYLIRAMYEWISDNGMTPYVLVDAGHEAVEVPRHAIKDGRIVLNIAGRAVASLELGNQMIRFVARFSGVSQTVSFPVAAVQAIYAQETGQGMMLPQDDAAGDAPGPGPDDGGGGSPDPSPKRPHLRVVK